MKISSPLLIVISVIVAVVLIHHIICCMREPFEKCPSPFYPSDPLAQYLEPVMSDNQYDCMMAGSYWISGSPSRCDADRDIYGNYKPDNRIVSEKFKGANSSCGCGN